MATLLTGRDTSFVSDTAIVEDSLFSYLHQCLNSLG